MKALPTREQKKIRKKFIDLYEYSPLYVITDDGKLIIAHAGIRKDYIGKSNKKVKTFVLYGDITGAKHPDGSPIRRDWAQDYDGEAMDYLRSYTSKRTASSSSYVQHRYGLCVWRKTNSVSLS